MNLMFFKQFVRRTFQWVALFVCLPVQGFDVNLALGIAGTTVNLSALLLKVARKETVSLFDVGDVVTALPLPKKAQELFNKIKIGSLKISKLPSSMKGRGFVLEGNTKVGSTPMRAQLLFKEKGAAVKAEKKEADQTDKKDEDKGEEEKSSTDEGDKYVYYTLDLMATEEQSDKTSDISVTSKDEEAKQNKSPGGGAAAQENEQTKEKPRFDPGIKEMGVSFILDLPDQWSFDEVSPELKQLDTLPFKRSALILSNFQYEDKQRGITIQRGLNFNAEVDFTGPFQKIQAFIDHLTKAKGGVIFKAGTIVARGSISNKPEDTKIAIDLPVNIGVDFEQLNNAGKWPWRPRIVRRIMTDRLTMEVAADASFGVAASAKLWFMTQPDPLTFKGQLKFDPSKVIFSLLMDGMYDPAFGLDWLALGDFGADIIIDYEAEAVLALIGCPITGLGFRGRFGIGAGEFRSSVDLAAAVAINSKTAPDVLLDGSIDQVRISAFIQLLAKMVGKDISLEELPAINLYKVHLGVAVKDTVIAGKKYNKGVQASAEIELWKLKGGFELNIVADEKKLYGKGWLKEIKNNVFTLSGTGPDKVWGTADDGPIVEVEVSPTAQSLYLSGMFEFAPLGFKRELQIEASKESLKVKSAHKLFNVLESDLEFSMNLEDMLASYVKFRFRQDFGRMFDEQIPQQLAAFRKKAEAKFNAARRKVDELDEKIRKAEADIAKAREKFHELAQEEIDRVGRKVLDLEKDIAYLKRHCKGLCFIKFPIDCAVTLPKKGVQLSGFLTYKNVILKPGIALSEGVLASTQKLVKTIGDTKVLQKIAKSALKVAEGTVVAVTLVGTEVSKGVGKALKTFSIIEAAGDYSGWGLVNFQLPNLHIKYVFRCNKEKFSECMVRTLDIEKVQVKDVTKMIAGVAKNAVAQIVRGVKKKKIALA